MRGGREGHTVVWYCQINGMLSTSSDAVSWLLLANHHHTQTQSSASLGQERPQTRQKWLLRSTLHSVDQATTVHTQETQAYHPGSTTDTNSPIHIRRRMSCELLQARRMMNIELNPPAKDDTARCNVVMIFRLDAAGVAHAHLQHHTILSEDHPNPNQLLPSNDINMTSTSTDRIQTPHHAMTKQ